MAGSSATQIRRAVELHAAGRLAEAETMYRGILSGEPDEPNCIQLLGMMLFQRGDAAAAEPLLRRSVELVPQMPDWHHNLALLFRSTGRREDALFHLRKVIELQPASGQARDNLGLMLDELRRPEEAAAEYAAAIKLEPSCATAHDHLAQYFFRHGQMAEAMGQWRIVVKLDPAHADAHGNLGYLLMLQAAFGEAALHLQQALRSQPRHITAMTNLAWLLFKMDRLDDATSLYRQALQIDPKHVGAWMNLGICLLELGDYKQAIECYRRGLSIQPDHAGIRSNLLLALHYEPQIDQREFFEEHRQFARIHETPRAAARFTNDRDRDPDRPLRIGFVSPDFRRHPVASFIEPILRCHDRASYIVSCYSDVQSPDQITERLRGYVSSWHDSAGLSDDELAEKIHANQEDILIDLAGHTARARLLAFARKPAPVQITYLGYLNTTGLEAMDYRLSDATVDPPGDSESFYSEQLLRLPCFFCYHPPQEAPEVGPLPSTATGRITFGSLNHPAKLNDRVLDLWTKLLVALPDAQLALTMVYPGESERRLRELFARRGIGAGRLRINARQPYRDYLALYNTIDIALDPFPFSGHTTTCDTLWMGVPVVTLPGQSYVSRMSAGILAHLNLPDLIASDEEDYLRIAMNLANDRPRLTDLRTSLRQRMRESIITDAAGFTGNVQRALRDVWKRWCSR